MPTFKVVGVDGNAYGPVSEEQIRRWIAEKRLNGQTPVQVEGSPEWKPLCSYGEFGPDLLNAAGMPASALTSASASAPTLTAAAAVAPTGPAAAQPLTPPPGIGPLPPASSPYSPYHSAPAANPKASNKIAAGVCGILLGGLGVHKFILGYTGAGLIMLLVTVLSCSLAWPLVHIIGLIEGIVYLTKSDDEFVRVYVDGQRPWF